MSARLTDYKISVGSEEVILPGMPDEVMHQVESPYDTVYHAPASTSRFMLFLFFFLSIFSLKITQTLIILPYFNVSRFIPLIGE